MNWLLNNAQILIFLVIIGSSVFGWVFKQLKEQAELKRIENERQRRKLEELRTGRVDEPDRPIPAQTRVPTPRTSSQTTPQPTQASRTSSAGQTRLEEIAARRQAQLAELRRRRAEQLAKARSGGSQPQSPPTSQPGRQPPRQPAGPAQRPAPRPVPVQQAPQKPRATINRAPLSQGNPPQAPMPSRRRRSKDKPPRETVEQHHLDVAIDDRHLESRLGTSAGAKPAVSSHAGDLRDMLQGPRIRDAILLSEILAPPVSMREDHLA